MSNATCDLVHRPDKSGKREKEQTSGCHENERAIRVMQAMAAFEGNSDYELSFNRGDFLEVINTHEANWWWCRLEGKEGYAPVNHLALETDENQRDFEISWQDDVYFERYSEVQYHLEMLLDKARTNAYRSAIQRNAKDLTGLTVLDVGCGSGILSMLCARESAVHHVFAVDACSMVNLAYRAIQANGLDNKISVMYGKVEEVEMREVDLIISEWMGTLLISECMFESVLIARDKFLKQGGRVWPTVASFYIAPCTAQSSYDSVSPDHWNEMYGLDFSAFKVAATHELLEKPLHKHVAQPDELLAEPHNMLEIDMETVTVSDLEVSKSKFDFQIMKCGLLHGFCTWFSVEFHPLREGLHLETDNVTSLDTGPYGKKTHWNHPLVLLDKPVLVEQGMSITGEVILYRHPRYRRHVRLRLSGEVLMSNDGCIKNVFEFKKEYKCWQ